MAYAPPALVALSIHGALAAGVWAVSSSAEQPPMILSSFEVVELPSSAAVATIPEDPPEQAQDPEPAPEPEPEAVPEPTPEPIAAPKPKPKPKPKPITPKAPPKPVPPKPAPVDRPKPVVKTQPAPQKALEQQDAAEAPAPAYVAPSQHALYLDNPKPAYPTMARKRGMEGRVVLRITVKATGQVADVQVEQSSGYALLDRAARSAVQGWRFAPATRGGIPVKGEVLVPFDFRLSNG